MKTDKDNKTQVFIILISLVFLMKDIDWIIFTSIILFCVSLFKKKSLDLDIGDVLVFYSMYRYSKIISGDEARAVLRALGFVAIYQLGKYATITDDKNSRISPRFIIAPATVLLIKGMLDYSFIFRSGGDIELYWPDWSGNLLHRSYHEYCLVMMASLAVFFVYYTAKVNKIGVIGIILSAGAVIVALYAKGRLAFWTSLISCIVVGIGIIVEEQLYKKSAFLVTTAVLFIAGLVTVSLFLSNSFGLHDLYEYSVWSEEGGLFFNDRFNMMGQQMKLYGRYLLNGLKNVEIDPGLINEAGEEVYYVSNSWLQIGREAKGIKVMLWVMAFSIYSLIILVKAWNRSRDVNKYIVISAFIGLTFLNMIEPIISNSIVFWSLEVYLAGIVRALYNNAIFPKRWETGILMNYV